MLSDLSGNINSCENFQPASLPCRFWTCQPPNRENQFLNVSRWIDRQAGRQDRHPTSSVSLENTNSYTRLDLSTRTSKLLLLLFLLTLEATRIPLTYLSCSHRWLRDIILTSNTQAEVYGEDFHPEKRTKLMLGESLSHSCLELG